MIRSEIETIITRALGGGVDFAVDRPAKDEHGDFASNVALVAAQQQGKNPRELAESLVKKLRDDKLFTKVEVAGPGFLNFTVASAAWQGELAAILKAKAEFGTWPATGKKIQVEFISINPTGPLHVGHGRGAFAGDVLANVLQRAGNTVEREYYINDAGRQIEILGEAVKGKTDAYKGEYIDHARKKVDITKSTERVGAEAAKLFIGYIQQTVKRMGIKFDVWFSETKELHERDEVKRVLADLAKAGRTYERDGALWLKSSEHGDDKDRVLRKSDGEYTYVAPDLAYHYHKLVKRSFDRAINIWGADHHGAVKRLKAGVEFIREIEGFSGQLVILLAQMVRLVEGGKELKMSKRTGTYVTLDELLDEVDTDVARFFYVMRSLDTQMDFDLDLAREQSQKNPVYYLKYAYARIAGILKKAGRAHRLADLANLEHPAELVLIKQLDEFPTVIAETAEDYQVQRLPHYALKLADVFHKFYEQCPVISDDKALTAARLKLVEGTRIVLKNVGDTLGITMPERM